MPRLISMAKTTAPFLAGTKTVTRRDGHLHAKPGDVYMAVSRSPYRELGLLRIRSVRREPLGVITAKEVALEGFPGKTPEWFIDFYCAGRPDPTRLVTRLRFAHLPEVFQPLDPPAPYPGGKRARAHIVWQGLGNPAYYTEPFAGLVAVFLQRPHRGCKEVLNDLNGNVVNWLRAVQTDPRTVAALVDYPAIELCLHARHEVLVDEEPHLRERLRSDPRYYDTELAAWWLWGLCIWPGGGWCRSTEPLIAKGFRGVLSKSKPTIRPRGILSTWKRSGIETWLTQISDRLSQATILCGDFERCLRPGILKQWTTSSHFMDPPYQWENRVRRRGIYASDCAEASRRAREWCIAGDRDQRDNIRICLAGLPGEHDELAERKWKKHAWITTPWFGAVREEYLWFSPACDEIQTAQKELFL